MRPPDGVLRVAVLPGDGIGAEVLDGPTRLLRSLPGVEVSGPWPVGASAAADGGAALPADTVAACDAADAILLGAVGEDPRVPRAACPHPETALHELRSRYDLRVSIREIPLGADGLTVVRNLRGGFYGGESDADADGAADVVRLDAARVAEVVGIACDLLPPKAELVSVDKANLTATGRLWRRVAGEVAAARGRPVRHRYVDRAAALLAAGAAVPAVLTTEGLFGDILSDVAAGRAGSPALCGSASVRPPDGDGDRYRCRGLFEPAHGSAPHRAGHGVANPIGGFLALVALLEWFPDTRGHAARLRAAVRSVLDGGPWSYDLAPPGTAPAGTAAVADAVLAGSGGGASPGHRPAPARPSRVPADRLQRWSARVLEAAGVGPGHAATAARVLAYADRAGIDSHGVARLPAYVALLGAGRIGTAGEPAVTGTDGAVALVDGRALLGHPVSETALDEAIGRARRYGVGWVGVHNSSHHGAAGYYVRRAADAGFVALALTNTGPVVAPAGATAAFLGTNPIACGVPVADGPPMVLDMATSAVSGGKIELAMRDGTDLPEGWALDRSGAPTRDPARVHSAGGALLPLGSDVPRSAHKGFGLGLAVELLTAVLSGGPSGPDVGNLTFRDGAGPPGVSHLFVVLDPGRLGDPAAAASRAAGLLERLRALPALDPDRPVRTPGQRADAESRRRRAEGIPLHPSVRARLDEVADDLGVPPLGRADA